MKVTKISDNMQLIEPNYNGIEKVLNCFIKLYEVANDKKVVDNALAKTMHAVYLFTPEQNNIEVRLDGRELSNTLLRSIDLKHKRKDA